MDTIHRGDSGCVIWHSGLSDVQPPYDGAVPIQDESRKSVYNRHSV